MTKHISIFALLIWTVVLVACDESTVDSQSEWQNTASTHIIDVSPLNHQTDIGLTDSVFATFDVDMQPDTITDSSFTLSDGNSYLPGVVVYDELNRLATLTPDSPFSLQTTYTASLNNGVVLNTGETMSPFTWSFTTLDGAWGTAFPLVNSDFNYAFNISVVIDQTENVFVIWPYMLNTIYNIYSTQYEAGNGWSTLEPIMNGCVANGNSSADIDGHGKIHVVAQHLTDKTICVNEYTPGTGWGTSQTLVAGNSETGQDYEPQLAVNNNGNAILGWTKYDAGLYAWANYYTPETGWEPAVWMENTDSSYGPQVAIDAEGNAMVVWGQYDNKIMAKYYSVANGWSATSDIRTEISATSSPIVKFLNIGEAIVVWKQNNGVVTRHFSEGSGWTMYYALDVDNDRAANTRAALFVGEQNNAMVVWADRYSTSLSDIEFSDITVRKYTPETGWGISTIIDGRCNSCDSIQGAFDRHGNAIVVWTKKDSDNRDKIWANRYRHNSGWSTSRMIDTSSIIYSSNSSLAIGPNGGAIAVWTKGFGDYDVWVNRFE